MKLQNLEKSTKILEAIKKLDSEIVGIEKHAMRIVSGEIKTNIEFSFEDKNKKVETKAEFDEDGSLIFSRAFSRVWMDSINGSSENVPTNTDTISNNDIPEELSLQLLGVMLHYKNSIRKSLLTKLERMGFIV